MEDSYIDLDADVFADSLEIPMMRDVIEPEADGETGSTEMEATIPEDRVGGDPTAATSALLALRGATGGVGVTSLAIEMAHVMAQSGRGEVCLVDLDFGAGMLAHYLDATVTPTIDDLRAEPHRLDKTFVRSLLFHHDAGFSVFGSPGVAGGNDAVNPSSVLAALDTIASLYPVVILDVPRITRPWTEATLKAADRVCLLSELTIPSLHVTRQRIAELADWGIATTDVALAKYERRSFKASIRQSDAERALGQSVTGVLGLDSHVTTEAMNCGLPSGKVSHDSRYVKDVAALARELSPYFAERRNRTRKSRFWGRAA